MQTQQAPVSIRFMEKGDLPHVLDCERSSHQTLDPDFDVHVIEPWAWHEDDILMAVRQRRDKEHKTFDTRAFVAELSREGGQRWTCGAMIYELRGDCYAVKFFTIHASADDEVAVNMLCKLKSLLRKEGRRKSVTIDIADGDDAKLKLFVGHGFKAKRVPNGFLGKRDLWRCTFTEQGLGKTLP